MSSEGATGTAGVAHEAVGVAREVETNLGVVGVLVLVVVAMACGWAYTVRALTRQGLVFAEELGRWMAIAGTAATRARKAEQRVAALDERIDRLTDRSERGPSSRRGEG